MELRVEALEELGVQVVAVRAQPRLSARVDAGRSTLAREGVVAEIALVQGIIDQETFSILVFMAIITTATVPVLLTKGVQWLRRRGELVKAGSREGTIIIGAGPVARELRGEARLGRGRLEAEDEGGVYERQV